MNEQAHILRARDEFVELMSKMNQLADGIEAAVKVNFSMALYAMSIGYKATLLKNSGVSFLYIQKDIIYRCSGPLNIIEPVPYLSSQEVLSKEWIILTKYK